MTARLKKEVDKLLEEGYSIYAVVSGAPSYHANSNVGKAIRKCDEQYPFPRWGTHIVWDMDDKAHHILFKERECYIKYMKMNGGV